MDVDFKYLKKAIDGDRGALFGAFTWIDTPQGFDYWYDQYSGRKPLDREALRSMMPKTRMQAGEKYLTSKGEYECLFVIDDVAYCVSRIGSAAYTWDANTGKSLCISDNYDIDLTPKPVVETRRGLVVFTDGVADWDSWTEVE